MYSVSLTLNGKICIRRRICALKLIVTFCRSSYQESVDHLEGVSLLLKSQLQKSKLTCAQHNYVHDGLRKDLGHVAADLEITHNEQVVCLHDCALKVQDKLSIIL